MAYLLTGVQHTKNGDITMPIKGYATRDEYLEKYHREMDYAISNKEFIGLGIKVFDQATLQDVLIDIWTREPVPEPTEESEESIEE